MKEHCSCCEVGKGKIGNGCRVEEDTDTMVDRLSNLPEPILHHILSFLDNTKWAVQTSVLSRSWNRVWKHVPALYLCRLSFWEYEYFQWFVSMVLDLRYPLSLRKLSYMDNCDKDKFLRGEEEGDELVTEFRDVAMCRKVIQYALSHDTQELLIDLDNEYKEVYQSDRFSYLFGTISKCNIRTLELKYVCLDDGLGSCGFGKLISLKLKLCALASDQHGDFFSNFPSLKDLYLSICQPWDYYNSIEDGRGLKISGPQLVSLRLDYVVCFRMEIVAPRLKFFSLLHDLESLVSIKLSFPSLVHAAIQVEDSAGFANDNKEYGAQRFISLFQGLNSATYLSLDYFTLKALRKVSEVLEQQKSSPFTRLKSLIAKTFRRDCLPDEVANYFLKGSASMNPNVERIWPCREPFCRGC